MKPIFPARLLWSFLATLVLLQACQTPPTRVPGLSETPSASAAAAAEQEGQYLLAAREYERLAATAPVPQRQEYQIKSVDLLLRAGQLGEARQKLGKINVQGLTAGIIARKQTLQARISIGEGRPEHALRVLAQAEKLSALEPALYAEIYRIRAQAHLAQGNTARAVQALVARERYMVDETDIADNHQQLWSTLSTEDRAMLQKDRGMTSDPLLAAWLDLALIVLDHPPGSVGLAVALDDWKRAHPGHPAIRTIYAQLISSTPGLVGPIQRIALLLPLSSDRSARAAEAVRDGFFAMNATNKNPDKPQIQVVDIGGDASQAPVFYEAAVAQGAQLVVGPLGLEAAEQLAGSGKVTVPTLLLSHVENEVSSDVPVFQFGLTPEQEAQQAAERAFLDGHRRAAVLFPSTPWGQRMLAAFRAHWERLGGALVVSQDFTPGANDYSQPVKDLLDITASQARAQALQARLRTRIRTELRRREDIDFVFLAADAKHGRLIKPQLNFFRAAQVPVYSTSYIFSGKVDAINDIDLDGIVFCDMPWMLLAGGRVAELRATLQPDWPYAYSALDRLFAFGVDAYGVIPYLNRMRADPTLRYNGITSSLALEPDGRLHRQLVWARFHRGMPQPLDGFINYGSADSRVPDNSHGSLGRPAFTAGSAG